MVAVGTVLEKQKSTKLRVEARHSVEAMANRQYGHKALIEKE